jgi:hypothetical protein
MHEEVSQVTNAHDPSVKHDMEQIHVILKQSQDPYST